MTPNLLQRPLNRRAVVLGAAGTAALGWLAPAAFAQSATPEAATITLAPFLGASTIHDVSITFDQAAYEEMIQIYADSGEKEWIEGTVTIDGTTYERVGLRLKGNSSLMGLRSPQMGGIFDDGGALSDNVSDEGTPSAETAEDTFTIGGMGAGQISADYPEFLPWLIKLNEFVSGQDHAGMKQLVIRANNSDTSLNEAVALDLLQEAGLASQQAAFVRFQANDSEPVLRLAIENPKTPWMEAHFGEGGLLYKAEATGNYSYRGDNAEDYVDVFDIEAGDTGDDQADLTPLFGFLDFINNADDATFADDLDAHLNVEGFATYLAMMNLIRNDDDIDGPGNNSYLYVGTDGKYFTVVPWDMNLAFGGFGGMGGFGNRNGGPGFQIRTFPAPSTNETGGTPEAGFPDQGQMPGNGDMPNRQGGFGGMDNILVQRTGALADFAALLTDTQAQLADQLYTDGIAESILTRWSDLLLAEAGDLVTSETVASESDAIRQQFTNPQDTP